MTYYRYHYYGDDDDQTCLPEDLDCLADAARRSRNTTIFAVCLSLGIVLCLTIPILMCCFMPCCGMKCNGKKIHSKHTSGCHCPDTFTFGSRYKRFKKVTHKEIVHHHVDVPDCQTTNLFGQSVNATPNLAEQQRQPWDKPYVYSD